MRRLSLVALLAAGGCAGSSVLLLPEEDGSTGAVAVLESGGKAQETLLDRPNSRTRTSGTRPATRAVDPAKIPRRDRALVDGLPPPPARFTLYFYEGSTRLVPDSRPQLDALFAEILRRPGAEVQVTGHTDTEGSAEDNDRLSLARATEIRSALIAEGLGAEISSAVGRGERELLVPTADNIANPANRRVEVIVR